MLSVVRTLARTAERTCHTTGPWILCSGLMKSEHRRRHRSLLVFAALFSGIFGVYALAEEGKSTRATPMNGLEFIAAVVQALAWPVIVLAIFFVFKRELARLLQHLSTFKHGELEFRFERNVEKLSQEVEKLGPAKPEEEILAIKQKLLDLARSAPEAAVTEAWRLVESKLVTLVRTKNIEVAPAVWAMPMVLAAFLHMHDALSDAQMDLLRRARVTRDEALALRQPPLSVEDAGSFVKLAVRLAASFGV